MLMMRFADNSCGCWNIGCCWAWHSLHWNNWLDTSRWLRVEISLWKQADRQFSDWSSCFRAVKAIYRHQLIFWSRLSCCWGDLHLVAGLSCLIVTFYFPDHSSWNTWLTEAVAFIILILCFSWQFINFVTYLQLWDSASLLVSLY